jgi:hypothetical protein
VAKHLAANFGDLAAVEHEPLHLAYRSNELLGRSDLAGTRSADVIRAHTAHIDQELQSRAYIEVGWPCWGALQHLIERFRGRVAIVHLTRHPIPTASSCVTHGQYRAPLLPGLTPEKIPVSPFDDGVLLSEYRELWADLDPFQRNLYFWAEVHSLGLKLEAESVVPWLRLRFEDLMTRQGTTRLLDFLELPRREEMLDAVDVREDNHESLTDVWWEVASAQRLPGIAATSATLGYDLTDVDEVTLRRRYLGTES